VAYGPSVGLARSQELRRRDIAQARK
jgi:hypothetical protein